MSCLRIAGASSIFMLQCLRLGSDLGCQSLCSFWICLCRWSFTQLSEFGDFMYWCILSIWHVYLELYAIYPLRSCLNIYACYICGSRFGDVTSISWINVLFTCIIALIEIGCYSYNLQLLIPKLNHLNYSTPETLY